MGNETTALHTIIGGTPEILKSINQSSKVSEPVGFLFDRNTKIIQRPRGSLKMKRNQYGSNVFSIPKQ